MVGNRHLFSAFLHGAILFLTVVLGCFGILGYLKYGKDVHQMLNTNIPPGNPVSMAVNIGICLGILLTFPLQIFPVIEIMEKYLFSQGKCGGLSFIGLLKVLISVDLSRKCYFNAITGRHVCLSACCLPVHPSVHQEYCVWTVTLSRLLRFHSRLTQLFPTVR